MKTRSENPSLQLLKETVQTLSGKWKLLIVTFLLNQGKARFTDLKRGVFGISAKSLTFELKHLKELGIVDRVESVSRITVVEYQLTFKGNALKPLLLGLYKWGATYIAGPNVNSLLENISTEFKVILKFH